MRGHFDGLVTLRLLGMSVLVTVCSLVIASTLQSGQPELFITEIDYDQPGTDSAEWVEIHNTREGLLFTKDIYLVLYDGDLSGSCAEYCRVDLSPLVAIPGGMSIVIGQHPCALLSLCDSVDAIQNGSPDVIVLEHLGNVIDSVEYGSSLVSSVCNRAMTDATDSDSLDGSIHLCLGSDWVFSTASTPCSSNACP